jgi:O-antigen/teichoic acid export membrane protein
MIGWLRSNRTSVRAAFILRLLSMAASAVLGLFWTRWILGTMGAGLYGLFLAFSAFPRLGGLGDLGVGGAVALRTGRYLGEKNDAALQRFLAAARGLFLVLAGTLFLACLLASPLLPNWLGFAQMSGAGSLPLLFALGSASIGLFVLGSYVANLNHAYGTVTWPILPAFAFGQLSLAGHWLLARQHAPLWLQYSPYLLATVAGLLVGWWQLKGSHPWLGNLRPVIVDGPLWKSLATASGWVYLCGLGNLIFTTTDRLLINAGFGPALIPPYQLNYKLPELALTLIITASYVSMPKLTQWMASPEAEDRRRAITEAHRLNAFQIFAGCGAALGYLLINNAFIKIWLGTDFQVPLVLQAAFACNLAITASGDVAIQLAGRCGDRGLRAAGLAIGGTGLLNLALSFLAMKAGSLLGIALATVAAQMILSLVLSRVVSRHLEIAWTRWAALTCLLPVAVVALAAGLRWFFSADTAGNIAVMLAGDVIILLVLSRVLGLGWKALTQEWAVIRSSLRG